MSDLLKAATKAAKADEKRMNIIYTPRKVGEKRKKLNIRNLI